MIRTEPIIRLQDVCKAFNSHPVLDGISIDIAPGQTTVIIGPSGCGKSVLLRHIVGLLKPDSGKVFFRQSEVSALSERKLCDIRTHFGFLFQGGALFDSMTVEQNICFPLDERAVGTRKDRKERSRTVLSLVGLDGLQSQYPQELSGGQKKRVALARAIALNPEVILYDEPTTGLDPIRGDLINELIIKLQNSLGATSIVVTHDMASARKVGNRILMLSNGRFIADTPPSGLDEIDNDTVMRFIRGQASDAELAELQTEQFTALTPESSR
ncbi:MAG: ATP-binding cassette domain-containing protein [Phycisphaerales bacterium]|jgi:phospholipid/cholesterol/gamma-HCH transport system ATP-binding protein|nr:ATP-binding cassette domain-containing protein [Phycisphaerales bacterium]